MKVAIARFYTNNLSEEVRKGQKEKIAQGWLPTKPPLGYKTTGDKGHKIHIIDETKAPLVRRMFELYATGNYSLQKLVDIMYEEGLRTRDGNKLVKSRMAEILGDPFYYGKMRWKDEIYEGHHEQLISKELFEAVQQKLTRKIAQPQYKKHLPVFKAKITCEECSGTITWEIQKGHWYGHHSDYYKYKDCPKKLYIRQEKVEEQLFPYFDKVAPKNERVLQWLEKALKESHSDEIDHNTGRREELTRLLKQADERMQEAYRDKLDHKMPVELCEKVIKDSTKEKEDLLNSLQKLGEARTIYYKAGYAIHELACKAKEIYLSPEAGTEEKRLLLSYAFSNFGLNGDKIRANYSLAFEFLLEWMPKLNKNFEPAEISSKQTKTALSGGQNTPMLRR